ncbi:MAG TPA: hypothetical protein VKF82_00235 [Candidatus Eremiobacteraceae bacterium]|nr:hypothetical protein [Candidatus Eremiobacteraceae bacterium]
MESFRTFQAAVALRSLAVGAAAAVALALSHQPLPAIALFAGTLIGMAYLFHIATSFDRLTRGGKRYLPFLTIESLLRVLLAGAAPFFIVGRGPWLGYFTYLAGFVAPLAVAIWVYKNRIVDGPAQTGATGTTPV